MILLDYFGFLKTFSCEFQNGIDSVITFWVAGNGQFTAGSKMSTGRVEKDGSNINKYKRRVVRHQFIKQRSLVTNSKSFLMV